MMKNESGAGQVSLLWVVFLVVLVLALGGGMYIAFSEKARLESNMAALEKTSEENRDKAQAKLTDLLEWSAVVGYRDSVTSPSDITAINDVVSSAKDRYPDYISNDVTSLDGVIDGFNNAYAAMEQQLTEAKQNFDSELALRQAAEENINTIEAEKNRRISELEAQLSDEQQRAQNQMEEDNQRISNLRSQLDDADQRVRDAENQVATVQERTAKEISLLNSRITAQAKKLEILREPEQPDGRILSVSHKSGLAMIDVGRKHGLRKGTKFEVFRIGKGGVMIPKGWVEVRDVDGESAKCGIVETIDPYDPILENDVITNPHFAREMQKTFVFLGDFPASLDKEFVTGRLTAMGALVSEQVDSTTDFLVLGDKDKSEFATELTDMPEFKLATQLGVQILRVRELADYIDY